MLSSFNLINYSVALALLVASHAQAARVSTSTMAFSSVGVVTVLSSQSLATDSEGRLLVNPLFYTACTESQYSKALLFQEACEITQGINSAYCPILSYFRECERVDSIEGLTPLKPDYKHVFLKVAD